MVQITGRITRDAEVKQLTSGKEVVNFTIALNDSYKPKDKERIEVVEYIQCAYWLNTKTAEVLKKGSVVEVSGRMYATAYMKGDDPKGQINVQVTSVKVHTFAKRDEQLQPTTAVAAASEQPGAGNSSSRTKTSKRKQTTMRPVEVSANQSDDLPF